MEKKRTVKKKYTSEMKGLVYIKHINISDIYGEAWTIWQTA